MNFNQHFNLVGKHAFLSASQYAWIRYDDDHLEERFLTSQAAKRGSELHAFAAEAIRLKIRQAKTKATLNMFVNDVIAARMASEQILYYSDNWYGTADAIGYRNGVLRVYDLKTGVSKASFDQLLIYCALFCHEYGFKPFELEYDLRIYQENEVLVIDVPPEDIPVMVAGIMDKGAQFSKRIDLLREEEAE